MQHTDRFVGLAHPGGPTPPILRPVQPDRYVTSAAEVDEIAARAQAAGRVAIDTEFLWERTYAPQLCLVQLAVGDDVLLVDPLEGAPLEPIAGLIADPAVEVIMHAATADLLAFGLRFGTRPTRVFDTQVAAGFVGLTATASLDRLLHDAIAVRLGHSESLSDWTRRPLSATQREYAGDDVRHLLRLTDDLVSRLDRSGRSAWAADELAHRYPDGESVIADPDEAWRKVQRRGRLRPRQLAILREVASWREREARRRDMPAGWVMKDAALVEVARLAPTTVQLLRKVRGIGSPGERDAAAVVAAVEKGAAAPPIVVGPAPAPTAARRVDAAAGLAGALLRARCSEQDIASELVATRVELDTYIEDIVLGVDRANPLSAGWRHEMVGRELIALVEGRVSLSLRADRPFLVISDVG